MTDPLRVTVLLFDGAEELDAFGPWEALKFWATLGTRPVEVRSAGIAAGPLRCSLGLTVTPDGTIDDDPPPDILIHPGGGGVTPLMTDEAHHARLRALSEQGAVLASVCNGALVLAAAGLLDGRQATTHWVAADELRAQFPTVDVQEGRRWIDAGPVVTAAGVTSGIDLALHLVHRFDSVETARAISGMLDHPWSPDADARATPAENLEHARTAVAPLLGES
ncbi:DJ-1/PfpI family protein [Pseudonocardia sp. HH130630-07]|uniref:DJ-1/PfpI family protein n=1 Tax=Pseudonocardia sp. HH130630-07 TaxID=1690815 RepID=UPI00081515CA|nr:DJ-1/PfpI family protein [Pseudonocardia sp. HH130630-07]ANY08195.1 AraC family transcriptional regulator [Pseudonocardia sp. HH130630-07]